jgi:SNF2 family DNA or RNA helicase
MQDAGEKEMNTANIDTRPIDVLCTYLDRTHQVKIQPRVDLAVNVYHGGMNGARMLQDGRGWTIPALSAHLLLPHFRSHFPDLRISFDKAAADLIYMQLEKEAVTSTLATADDGDVPDVLSVKLRNFQRAALAYLLRGTPRKVLALDTGLGKTAVASAYVKIRKARALWITKPALVNNLRREIKKLTSDNAAELKGTSPNAEHIRLLSDKSYQHIIITYDSLSRSLLEDKNDDGIVLSSASLWAMALTKLGNFDCCVIDEAHNMKNRSTGRWKVINMLKEIPSFLLLTATPLVNNGLDFYSLLNVLDSRTFGSESEFTRAYLSPDGRRVLNPRQMQKDLLPYVFRRKKTDVLKDLPAKIRQHHVIELSDEWKKKYDAVMQGIYLDLKNNKHDVPDMFLAQLNRFRQVVSQAKVEHTAEYAMQLEEAGEKCLIFTQWKETAEALGKELSCDVITGDVDQNTRTVMQDRFNNNQDVKHLVLTLDVGREGLNLTAASAIVFNDFGWNPMIHDQAEGRAWGRLNDPHGCLVYYVAVKDTVDQFMMETLARKQELIDSGVEGVRGYATEQVSLKQEMLNYLRKNMR